MSEPALDPEGTALLERVRELAPRLAAWAPEGERLRRPVDGAIDALREAGVFQQMLPPAYGGLGLDLDAFLEVGLALGEADVSTAWVANFYVEHHWMLCQFPESFQKALFAPRRPVLAPAAIAPTGEAREEPGGWRVSGRWRWGTGAPHAEWALVGALPHGDAGPPVPHFFALPIADVRLDDTWYVDGMAATGSQDLVIEDVFVPQERCGSLVDMVNGQAEGARLHPAPLYRTPMIPILMVAASTPILGRARAVVREYREDVVERTRSVMPVRQGERPAVQMRLARAAIEVRQAELLLRDVVAEVCEKRDEASLAERARWSSSIAHAVHQARGVVQTVAEAAGASAHFQSHPLQRALRDVNVASCHVVFDLDAQHELYGRLQLGLDPGPALF